MPNFRFGDFDWATLIFYGRAATVERSLGMSCVRTKLGMPA
jgi:hypothetical protein